MEIIPLPALSDNYLWLIRVGRAAAVVDPGDAQVVRTALQRLDLELKAILVTHHHADHVGGVEELAAGALPVFGPGAEAIRGVDRPLREGETAELPELGLRFRALEVPGHTRGHIAYLGHDVLFCGDTLFNAGCGRLFEGTPAQMHASLARLAALPGGTQVFCAHEYTLANLRFACAAEPDNPARDAYLAECERLRAAGQPTLPTTIERQRQVNPFLRCGEPGLRVNSASPPGASELEVFAALRAWKDRF